MRRAAAILTCLTALAPLGLLPLCAAAPARPRPKVLAAGASGFLLNGKPFQLISGEIHYPRVPRAYWRDRFKKARAMGLDAVSTHVFWNLHEPWAGQYDFHGEKDVAAFVKTAQEEGLLVLLRPGPYVGAEWDLGGLPAWLLADGKTVLRSADPAFLEAATRWLARLGKELAPLLGKRGGPIVAVQVENELGSFAKDPGYLGKVRDALVAAGFGDALLYTADGPGQLPDGSLPGLPATVSFGPGEAEAAFAALARFRPKGPRMAGEYRAGWFDRWGEPHRVTDAAQQARELGAMLAAGRSVNLYMFHGGTTFGLWNGADVTKGRYAPQTTSHDYDAALDEAGRPTPRFFAFRDAIAKHRPKGAPALPPLPPPIPVRTLPEVRLDEYASLWLSLTPPIQNERPRPMETYGQGRGYVLYRTTAPGPVAGDLEVRGARDWVAVFLDGRCVGTLDRRLGEERLWISVPEGTVRLDLLVESTGRVDSGESMRVEQKGVAQGVFLGGAELTGWAIHPMPLELPPYTRIWKGNGPGPAFYRGTFRVEEPSDTFLDMRGWRKGIVWVNGKCLGRHWDAGPQRSLYLPGAWLVKGENDVVVFEVESHAHRTVRGLAGPLLVDAAR